MQWHWDTGRFCGVGHRREIRTLNRIRLWCACEIDRRLREGKQPFGQTDELYDIGSSGSLDHRLRICEADVFRSEDAQTARDENRIGAAFDHSRQPVERRVDV